MTSESQPPCAVDAGSAPHRSWGDGCDAWALLETRGLSVVEEHMPPGTAEVAHHHVHATQFFFVLDGRIAIELDAGTVQLRAGQGHCVDPGDVHTVVNPGPDPARFLAVASPTTQHDRVDRRQ